MNAARKEALIRRAAAESIRHPNSRKVRWSRHAIAEIAHESLDPARLVQALVECEVIEDYPLVSRPLPDCLVLAWLPDGRPVHAVIAINEPLEQVLVVTVYIPTEGQWEDDWKTRKTR